MQCQSTGFAQLQQIPGNRKLLTNRHTMNARADTTVNATAINGNKYFLEELLGVANHSEVVAPGVNLCRRDVVRCTMMCVLAMYSGDARSYCDYYG